MAPPSNVVEALAHPFDPGTLDMDVDELIDDPQVRRQLDGLARIARQVFGVSMSVISLARGDFMHFVGSHGIASRGAPRTISFCDRAMRGDDIMIVPDALADAVYADNPLVLGAPHIRFYAGYPLISSMGQRLGSVCVFDSAPRQGISDDEREHLTTLGQSVLAILERWINQRNHAQDRFRDARALDHSDRRFHTLAAALPQLVWSTPPDGMSDYFSAQWVDYTGAPEQASHGTGWLDFVAEQDRPAAVEAWTSAVASGEPYEVEYRLRRHDGTYQWMLARGLPVTDEDGAVVRWVGTCTNIHDRVMAGEALELMAHELSHRVKNLFAVVQSLVTMTLRPYPDMKEVAHTLQGRLHGLSRTHDILRPRVVHGAAWRSDTTLQALMRQMYEPHLETMPDRITIRGDDPLVSDDHATPVAMFLHEVMTNALIHGALSAPDGRVDITIAAGDDVVIEWHESGAAVKDAPKTGFGLRLASMSIERQLEGALSFDWSAHGLRLRASLSAERLAGRSRRG